MTNREYKLKPPASGLPDAKVKLRQPISRIQHFWQRGKFYEEKVLKYIYRNHSGGIFVDCGSSIGNHSLFFSMYCKPYFVVSIEPVRGSLSHQKDNLALNEVNNVHCFNVALSDRPGRGRMVRAAPVSTAKWPLNEGMWNLEPGKGSKEITTLDALLKDILDITLIKLDIEGFELLALEGARGLLTSQHPALFIEVYPERRLTQFGKFLSQFGYSNVTRVYKNMFEFTTNAT
jgi:protein O-GlcNAc transferase